MQGLYPLAVLWEGKTKAGRDKISGSLGAVRLMLLRVDHKRSPRGPDWKLFIAFGDDVPSWQRRSIADALAKIGQASPFQEDEE